MARLARIVIPDVPHHVTQRGNRGEQTFFNDQDYQFYLQLLAEAAVKADAEIWCYCLMPNHIHAITVPRTKSGLKICFAETHRQYTRRLNLRLGVKGHLWQGRFGSVAMDEAHLLNAIRYVSMNPVRAGLVKQAKDWPWSSARAHLNAKDDLLVHVEPALQRIENFATLLEEAEDFEKYKALRSSEYSGRPIGNDIWLDKIENELGTSIKIKKRGPKPNSGTVY